MRLSDLTLLSWRAGRTHATAIATGAACSMAPGELHSRLPDGDAEPPRRVFCATAEGRRAAGISDARAPART